MHRIFVHPAEINWPSKSKLALKWKVSGAKGFNSQITRELIAKDGFMAYRNGW